MAVSTQDWTKLGEEHRSGIVEPEVIDSQNSVKIRILQKLSNRLGETIFEMWFTSESLLLRDDKIVVLAENEFLLHRLNKNFGSIIKDVVSLVCGAKWEVSFEVATDLSIPGSIFDSANSKKQDPRSAVQSRIFEESGESVPASARNIKVRRRRGLESFWFGLENRLAEAGIQQMIEQLGQFSPLFFHGPSGCGKTHLLESVVAEASRKMRLRRCVFLSAEQFTTYFVAALRGTGLPMFRRKYRDLDLLAIDDIQFFAGKTATLNEFQHTIDNLTRNGKQVILSADRPPLELSRLGTDINARVTAGLVCPLNYPNSEGREKIIRDLCRQRGFKIPADVVEMIAHRLARDVRRLSGAINRIHAVAVATNQTITVELAQQVLCDLFSVTNSTTSLISIEKAVCDFCGLKPSELKSASRRKRICSARMLSDVSFASAYDQRFFGNRGLLWRAQP